MPNYKGKPWHKQNFDTDKSYMAFRTYIDCGIERTLLKSYRIHTGIEKAKTPSGYFATWARKLHWAERATAYEEWVNQTEDQEYKLEIRKQQSLIARRRLELNEKAWNLAQSLMAKAEDMLKLPVVEKTVVTEDGTQITMKPVKFRMSDAARMVEIADKLCRLSTDMSTENVSLDVAGELKKISKDTGVPYKVLWQEYKDLTGKAPEESPKVDLN